MQDGVVAMSWASDSCGVGAVGVARGQLPGSSATAPGRGWWLVMGAPMGR